MPFAVPDTGSGIQDPGSVKGDLRSGIQSPSADRVPERIPDPGSRIPSPEFRVFRGSIPPVTDPEVYDVAVLGGGNAALCAALAAADRGARVIVLERAPRVFRGGNSRHTRNLRCMHAAPTDVLTEQYTEDEFMTDLLRVTGGATNETLARMVVRASANAPARLRRVGVRLQPSLRGTLQLGRTNAFFLGGGKALMNSYYAAAERAGVDVRYDADVVGLEIRDGRFESATIREGGRERQVRARAVVLAA